MSEGEQAHKAHLRRLNPEQVRRHYDRALRIVAEHPHRVGAHAVLRDVIDVAEQRGIDLGGVPIIRERGGSGPTADAPHGERVATVWGPVPLGTGA